MAAVWGTTDVGMRTLARGESYDLGGPDGKNLPVPDGIEMSAAPIRGGQSGWEVDARGAVGGLLRLRGRDEDPVAVARSGAPIPIVPGDFGILQYGLFGIFFQFTSPPVEMTGSILGSIELLTMLALFSSGVLHLGGFGLARALSNPPSIPKPLELTSPEEFAARFGLRRAIIEEPPPAPPAEGDKSGGAGVKDPGAKDKKVQGGGQKMAGAEGKLGKTGPNDHAEIPGDIKPATNLGGLRVGNPQHRVGRRQWRRIRRRLGRPGWAWIRRKRARRRRRRQRRRHRRRKR